jgi:uncharacterized membrane protein
MGIDSTGYRIVLLLHILCAIVGFGAVMLNGLYGREAKRRQGPGGLAISEANYAVSGIAEYFIYAVFVFGFALVFMSDEAWAFDQTWIWLSMALYVVGLAISHAVVFPNARKMKELSAELVAAGPPPAGTAAGPPPQVVEMQRRGRALGLSSSILHVLLVVIIGLMIWKPGA